MPDLIDRLKTALADRYKIERHLGEGGTATAMWSVVPGSGTGDLRGLRGEGGFASAHADEYAITLDYDFE